MRAIRPRGGFAGCSPLVIDLTSQDPYSRRNGFVLFHAGRLLRMLLCAAPDYGISRQ
jgi:hypothetical protein